FIGQDRYERFDALSKVHASEVAVPRFFVAPAEGARLKEAAAKGPVSIRVRAEPSRWENRVLRDLWVLIPGRDPDLAREVAVITAPMDANSVVPELAAGAQAGANLYLLTRLLEQFKTQPPARSVLLAAVNAHTQNFRGERMLAWHLLAADFEKTRDVLSADRRTQRVYVDYYSQLKLDSVTNATDEAMLIDWRTQFDDNTGKNLTVKEPIVARAKRDVNRLKLEQVDLVRLKLAKPEFDKKRAELEAERTHYVKVLTLFNKVGIQTQLSQLSAQEFEILKGYVRWIIDFNRASAEQNEKDLELDKRNGAIRDILKGRKVPFVVTLELDWDSPRLGFCSMNLDGTQRWGIRFGANATRLAGELPAVTREQKDNLFVDTMTLVGGLTERHFFPLGDYPNVQKSAVQYFQGAAATPAFSLRNVFTAHGRSFLPTDTFAALDGRRVAEGLVFVPALLRSMLEDRSLTATEELLPASGASALFSTQLKTFKFDELAASVYPDIPVSGSAVTLRSSSARGPYQPLADDAILDGDVINGDIALTDQRAASFVYGIQDAGVTTAFHFDADFITVDHAIDAGNMQLKVNSNLGRGVNTLTMALFECWECPLWTTADPSLVSASPIVLSTVLPFTAKGNSSPKKYGMTGIASALSSKGVNPTANAPAAFYLPRGESVKLITPGKRLALNATEKEFEGAGFTKPGELGLDLFVQIARDMSVLNHARVRKLQDVANEFVHDFLRRGDQCMDRVKAAAARHDHLAALQSLYESLGAQVKSYQQAKQTTDDMLKAVVVYMALLLPFCFFVQKLIFKFVRIEHEMGMFALLFVLTFIVFRLIHPAFRIALAAEAIFIGFVMGALGLFVINILHGRFEGEMQLLFRSYTGGIGDVGYSTVTQQALLIGVNNMKRRRIRTMLTTATIVLVAFTMLSFTSISKKVNPTIISRAKEVLYTGFMYHWPGKSQMDEATLTVFRHLFEKRGQVVVRRWLVANDSAPMRVESPSGKTGRFEALLGLSAAENGFLGAIPLIGGRFFSSDQADEVVISAGAASLLGLDPNRLEAAAVDCLGRRLRVVGVFDDAQFRDLQDLNGASLLPIKRIAKEMGLLEAVAGKAAEEAAQQEAQEDQGLQFYVDPAALLVLPVDLAERLGARPYSVSIKLKENEPIWPIMDLLLTATQAKFFMSSLFPFSVGEQKKEGESQSVAAGVYYVGSNYSTSIGGLAVLLIPLFIASTIILNTMLGSVYERKKEIAIYNAVGLNPHHIGMFFLAESFVYGVIGSVGGYLIGQVLSIVISKFNLVTGINLNYSSLSVAYVILFTIAIVLLSTLYPAVVATKAAVPSGKRKWSLPAHDGHRMHVVFPFIYQPHLAVGVLGYLREYFGRFTAASIGDLIATPERHEKTKDDRGRDAYTMDYHTALAPYDLGVTQRLSFRLVYEDRVQAYRLELRIDRISGQDSNWVTTNRPFLEVLRKYLLRWRNLDVTRHELYVRQAEQELGG
ncbi:MAG: FtsX-like permease family protein, partial [Lentisphaerae bacterium]|nr:FtsX-like permease family protein [Lentisphaerota bacterium]